MVHIRKLLLGTKLTSGVFLTRDKGFFRGESKIAFLYTKRILSFFTNRVIKDNSSNGASKER